MTDVVNYQVGSFTYYRKAESVPDESKLRPHTHDNLELYYFLSGDCVFYIEGKTYKLKPGDVFIIRNSETHYLKLLSKKPYERIVLNFSAGFLNSIDPDKRLTDVFFCRRLGTDNCFHSKDINYDFLSSLKKIEKCQQNSYINKLEITLLLASILLEINKSFNSNTALKEVQTPSETISEIIIFINENITANISLSEIADKFYISKSYLNRIFKLKMGFTVWEYITTKRLILAKECICNEMSPTKAAEFVGFNDYSTFYRQFIKHFNYPPNETKKHISEE